MALLITSDDSVLDLINRVPVPFPHSFMIKFEEKKNEKSIEGMKRKDSVIGKKIPNRAQRSEMNSQFNSHPILLHTLNQTII